MNATPFSLHRLCLAALGLCLGVVAMAQHVQAAATAWSTSEGGRMRIVSLPAEQDGQIEAVLQIDLKPGWITYWREPGEAGIPPKITPDPGSGATLESVSFPVPKLIKNEDIVDIGYDRSVDIPFTLKLGGGDNGRAISLTAFIGVCLNICIPFESPFELGTGETASEEDRAIIAASKTRLPEAPSDDFHVQNFHITPDKSLLGVELRLPEDAPKAADIYVAGPPGYAYFEPQNLVRDKRKLSFYMNIKGLPKSYNPKGQTWYILVTAGERSMEAPLTFPQQ